MEIAQVKTVGKAALRAVKQGMYYTNITPMPFRILADLTDRCNFRCPTCSKWRVKPGEEMTTSDWKEVLAKLKNKSLTGRISFAGGEATLRPDLCELIKYAKESRLNVTVVTNGFLLTEKLLREFERAGLNGLVVSLNGVNRATHDESRGVSGSFDRIMNILPIMSKFRYEVNLETIIMETNLEQLILLVKLSKQYDLYGIHFQALGDVGAHYALINHKMPDAAHDWYKEARFWIRNPAKASQVLNQLIRMQKDGYRILNPSHQLKRMIQYYSAPETIKEMKCMGGVSSLYIDPYGEVRVCYGFEPIGNIRESEPLTLWRSNGAREIRRKVKHCDKMCRLLNNNY
ncbi:MAG: hypothetical protein QG577_1977 [Thermodesulfobacteriota bacterium]|nr:hypothetical protein [Thermodesulfobacteriota bacterium]